jgi:ATP/maltotriose-dependent transcriptional regulator MalT
LDGGHHKAFHCGGKTPKDKAGETATREVAGHCQGITHHRRPRLSASLDAPLEPTTRLTIVSAPPGYGRVGPRGGLGRRPAVPIAWVSLDATSGDPARLARQALSALGDARPAAGALAQAVRLRR